MSKTKLLIGIIVIGILIALIMGLFRVVSAFGLFNSLVIGFAIISLFGILKLIQVAKVEANE